MVGSAVDSSVPEVAAIVDVEVVTLESHSNKPPLEQYKPGAQG